MSEQAVRVPWRPTNDLQRVCVSVCMVAYFMMASLSFSMMLCVRTSLQRVISVCQQWVGGVGGVGRPVDAGEAPLIM